MPLTRNDVSPECWDAGWLDGETPSVSHKDCSDLLGCNCRCHELSAVRMTSEDITMLVIFVVTVAALAGILIFWHHR